MSKKITFIQLLGTKCGFPFSFAGAESIVAIMIGNLKGMEILHRIESGLKVTMAIEVGKKHSPWMNQYSIFFISVSFFIVTAATMGYFVFYSARRLRIARAQSKKQVSLCHCPLFIFFKCSWTSKPPCCGSWGQNTGWAPKLLNLFLPQEGKSVIFKNVSLSVLNKITN